jgi:hypothetical protein
MSLILNGTDGLSDVDGTAGTPAIRGTDANTGIFFPAADTIAFSEGGAEAMRITSTGSVGIGTTSTVNTLDVRGSGAYFYDNSTTDFQLTVGSSISTIGTTTATPLAFKANNTERMRIDSSGDIFAGGTTINDSTGSIYSKTNAKVFVQWVGSNGTINQSKNVSSVTRNSTGDYTVTFSFTFTTNYAIVLGGSRNNAATDAFSMNYYNQTGSSIRVNTSLPAINFTDAHTADLVIFA